MKLKLLRKIVKKFHDETKEKYSIASQFIILDSTEPENKKKVRDELFMFQHAGIDYCICGHDKETCHPNYDVCYNRKCDCLQYVPSEHNDKLDVTKDDNPPQEVQEKGN